MERGGPGDAGDGGKWRGRSRAEVGDNQNPVTHSGPGGDHLLPSQLTDVARLQKHFADVFPPARAEPISSSTILRRSRAS